MYVDWIYQAPITLPPILHSTAESHFHIRWISFSYKATPNGQFIDAGTPVVNAVRSAVVKWATHMQVYAGSSPTNADWCKELISALSRSLNDVKWMNGDKSGQCTAICEPFIAYCISKLTKRIKLSIVRTLKPRNIFKQCVFPVFPLPISIFQHAIKQVPYICTYRIIGVYNWNSQTDINVLCLLKILKIQLVQRSLDTDSLFTSQ